ncbi:hypothetical protein NFJ02_42g109550 [Pycnococcus provasolii]
MEHIPPPSFFISLRNVTSDATRRHPTLRRLTQRCEFSLLMTKHAWLHARASLLGFAAASRRILRIASVFARILQKSSAAWSLSFSVRIPSVASSAHSLLTEEDAAGHRWQLYEPRAY